MTAWFAYDGWLNPELAEHETFNRVGTAVLALPAVLSIWQWLRDRDERQFQSIDPTAEPVPQELPAEFDKWNWGAFLLTPAWSVGHRVWWGLFAFVPGVGLILSAYLGYRGNRLAWASGEWSSGSEFQAVERRWAVWAVGSTIYFGVLIAAVFVGAAIEAA